MKEKEVKSIAREKFNENKNQDTCDFTNTKDPSYQIG